MSPRSLTDRNVSDGILPSVRDRNVHIGLYTVKVIDSRNDGDVRSLKRKKEVSKAMSSHVGTIWSNTPGQVHRRTGPGTNYPLIDNLRPSQQVIILCFSHGETQ